MLKRIYATVSEQDFELFRKITKAKNSDMGTELYHLVIKYNADNRNINDKPKHTKRFNYLGR